MTFLRLAEIYRLATFSEEVKLAKETPKLKDNLDNLKPRERVLFKAIIKASKAVNRNNIQAQQ